MMLRALCDRRHSGAPGIRQCTDWSSWPRSASWPLRASDLTTHDTPYLSLNIVDTPIPRIGVYRMCRELMCMTSHIIDSRYIAVQYNTILHPAQQLWVQNFGQTSNSRKTPISRTMDVFRELFGEKWPRDNERALYSSCLKSDCSYRQHVIRHFIVGVIDP